MVKRDERIMTDYEVHQMERTAKTGWGIDAVAHMIAVNEQLKQIEKFTTDTRVLKLVREILYGEDA